MSNENKPKTVNIAEILNNFQFRIPIYQRKYAWTKPEIDLLLEDIMSYATKDKTYFLGTIVTKKNNKVYNATDGQKNNDVYDVIDGQQRLITIYLLHLYLRRNLENLNSNIKTLEFEARDKYKKFFEQVKSGANIECSDDGADELDRVDELIAGYKYIKDYFENKKNGKSKDIDIEKQIYEKMEKTEVVLITVPDDTDLNKYFEIMNTRGEQLELHHILKARILSIINEEKEREVASKIWDNCSNMNYYFIDNLEKSMRVDFINFSQKILEKNISDNIDEIWCEINKFFNESGDNGKILKDTLTELKNNFEKEKKFYEDKKNKNKDKDNKEDDDVDRYESIVSFPYFLLHVNAVIKGLDNEESHYDEKKLLDLLGKYYEEEKEAKKYICYLLYCRLYYDNYIIKNKRGSNNLDLQLKKYVDKDNSEKLYNTYSEEVQKKLIILQGVLRITYMSQKSMQWITIVLKHLIINREKDINILQLLEDYCIDKIKKHYEINDSDSDDDIMKKFSEKKYNNISRIVFTYLDYLLYKNSDIKRIKDTWNIQYRNSIEHFYPQQPANIENQEEWEKWQKNNNMHSFGNLALITPSANSWLSNKDPQEKIGNENIIKQSLKLGRMAEITNIEGWTVETMKKHEEEMFKVLLNEVTRKKDDELICNENN